MPFDIRDIRDANKMRSILPKFSKLFSFSILFCSETRESSGGSSSSSKSKSNESMCNIRLSHDRWGLSVKLAEARWAQQQARERELEEVKDFLQ